MAWRKHSAVFISLYGYTGIRGVGRSAFMILYPLYILSLGYTTSDLGVIVTISSLITVSILPMMGFFVDKGWSREIQLLSGLFTSASLILPVLNPSYPSLVASYFLSLLSFLAWTPARNRIMSVLVEERVMGRAYGGFVIVFNILRTITAFIIGYTVIYGYPTLLVASGIIVLIGTIIPYIILLLEYEDPRTVKPGFTSLLEAYRSLFRFPRSIYPLIYFSVIDSFAWRLWFPLLNAYLKQYRLLADTDISDYNTLLGVSMLLTAYIAGHFTDKLKPVKSLMLYEIMGIIGLVVLQLPYPALYGSSIFLGFSIAFWVPAYNVLTTYLYGPRRVGRLRALTDTVRMTAGIPSPQIGGMIISYNPLTNFMLSVGLMSLAILPLRRIRYGGGGEAKHEVPGDH